MHEGMCETGSRNPKLWVLKLDKGNFTTSKPVYNESANFLDRFVFYIDGPWFLTEIVPVMGMECIASRTCLGYKRDYKTPYIFSRIIKPATMENVMSFPAQITTQFCYDMEQICTYCAECSYNSSDGKYCMNSLILNSLLNKTNE